MRTPWLSKEEFYRYIDGQQVALPGGEPLTICQEQIEQLSIEPGEDAPESEGANVSFVVRTPQGRIGLQGLMSLHTSDASRYPIVNLNRGWNVTKQ
jgi:hypothetical protein